MAAKSLRCIAFAYRPIEGSDVPISEEASSEWNQPEDDLILIGICGIKVWACHVCTMKGEKWSGLVCVRQI